MSYYLSPRFLDKIAVHITKNYLDLAGVKVPLILGVHGRKGEGKSFQCDLAFERMGVGVVHMSAGELESPDAGDPARLIRLRYREAADWVKVNGKMAVLMINDIDAGMGRIDQFTQYTVNTQLVAGTLMNIADKPTDVQLPGSYDAEPIQRIPIVVTGNDFSTLYAPLVRDGRMEKFYWEPNRADRIGIVSGIFEQDTIPTGDIEKLVDAFPTQSIDFYSALHSRLYDEQVRQFIQEIGIERVSARVVNSSDKLPEFRQPNFSLHHLIELGQSMVEEQQRLQELRLVTVYNRLQSSPDSQSHERSQSSQQQHSSPPPSPPSTGSSIGNGVTSPHNGATYGATQTTKPSADPGNLSRLVQNILDRGQGLGIEVVDARRFRTNSWQCYRMIQASVNSLAEAQTALSACLAEHPQDYIRLVAIDPTNRRRTSETIVHRP
jgi:ribulose bisphosphate carboxylase small subunit